MVPAGSNQSTPRTATNKSLSSKPESKGVVPSDLRNSVVSMKTPGGNKESMGAAKG